MADNYRRHPYVSAQGAALTSDATDGRFILGLGVSHQPVNRALATARPWDSSPRVPSSGGFAEKAAQMEHGVGVAALSERLLDAVCLLGPLARCREQFTAFRAAGVDLPTLLPPADKGRYFLPIACTQLPSPWMGEGSGGVGAVHLPRQRGRGVDLPQ